MGKIIFDKPIKKKEGFLLSLKDLENLKDIHLDLKALNESLREATENKDFEKALGCISLLDKLSTYGHKESDFSKLNFYYNKILFNYNNLNGDDVEKLLSLYFEIKSFRSYYNSLRYEDLQENFLEKVDEAFKIIDSLEVEVKLKKEYLEEGNIPTIKEYKLIEKYLGKNKKNSDINQAIEKSLRSLFEEMKNLEDREIIEKIIEISKGSYEEKFYYSIEFSNIILDKKYCKFENYDDLLEAINKEHLLYRFNKSKNIADKADLLVEIGIGKYGFIPKITREIIINRLMKKKSRFNIMEEFFDILDEEIKDLKVNGRINFLPIKM